MFRNLGLASGIAAAGSGIGQFVMAPLILYLDQHVGLAPTLLVMAAMFLFTLPLSLIFKKSEKNDKDCSGDNKPAHKNDSDEESKTDHEGKNQAGFRNFVFLASVFFCEVSFSTGFVFTADRARVSGIHLVSPLLSIMGIANCLGRIGFGQLLDLFPRQSLRLTGGLLCLNSGMVLASNYLTTFPGQAAFTACFGLTYGASVCSQGWKFISCSHCQEFNK